jgi:FlaA1/EpsC-like NDP-sugar epimerase
VIPFRPTVLGQVDIDWYAFLARPRLPSPSAATFEQLRESSILVTGAGGSIGSALSLRLAALCTRNLVLLDASEQALYRLQSALAGLALDRMPHLVLGSATDPVHLDEVCAMHRPDLIFHAAAYKHVALLEDHPVAAIANNAIGTHSLVECARMHGVSHTVLLSTDKAVAPSSILGASKRIAERITLAHSGVVVRLGNVLGTHGSVVEIFLQQIRAGGPVTLCDQGAERFFLTCEEAVDILLAAAVAAEPGSLLVPHLDRAHSILDLARFLIATPSSARELPLKFIGLRPGDKLHEALWSPDEKRMACEVDGCLRLEHGSAEDPQLHPLLSLLQSAVQQRDLANAMRLVQQLVPDYTPSPVLAAYMEHLNTGILQS